MVVMLDSISGNAYYYTFTATLTVAVHRFLHRHTAAATMGQPLSFFRFQGQDVLLDTILVLIV